MKKVLLKILENTYARVLFSFELSSVISKVSVVDFEHEEYCYGSNLWNALANNSKLAIETLKQDGKFVKS